MRTAGIPTWLVGLIFLGVLKAFSGLASFTTGLAAPPEVADAPAPAWNLLAIAIYCAAGIFLAFGGRRDRRALHLGGFFVLIAATFADRAVEGLAHSLATYGALFEATVGAEIEAFTPLLIWLFARDFPEALSTSRVSQVIRAGILLAIVSGTALFALNLWQTWIPDGSWWATALFAYADRRGKLFTPWVLILSLAALPPIIVKARLARPAERRRVGLFVASLVLSLGPVCLTLLLEAVSPAYRRLVTAPSLKPVYDALIFSLLLLLPPTTAYAVVVNQVLNVRLVVRKAVRYALTRYGAVLLMSVPFIGLAGYLYRHRSVTLAMLLGGAPPLALLGLGLLGVVALTMRRPILEGIDRHFFRERYDAREMLSTLVESTRRAATVRELAELLCREIDRALHVDAVAVLVRHPRDPALIAPDGAQRPLPAFWTLALLAGASSEPLDVDLDDPRSPFQRLSAEEREWLSDGACRLLVPLLDRDGTLIGLVTLGEKKSELPFDRDDRELLSALGAAGALTIENLLLRAATSPLHRPAADEAITTATTGGVPSFAGGDEMARECRRCRTFQPPGVERCPLCRETLAVATVPYVLAGKFRFQSHLGAGGMGVVYLAVDLALERPVAIKTLPRVSPEYAMRLRREARVAASVSHPHLATVFGIETWRGTPMLVFEFVEAGTLADRLAYGTLSAEAVIRLGLALANALDRAHGAGVIHGDIKPSNIGFQRDDTIKLLDFGVARLLGGRGFPVWRSAALDDTLTGAATRELPAPESDPPTLTFGTVAYLSPEAVRGESPDPTFDLWSLALVMYESLTGRNPLFSSKMIDTVRLISDHNIPDLRAQRRDCPPALADFVMRALARSRSTRPGSAAQFEAQLRAAAETVVASL